MFIVITAVFRLRSRPGADDSAHSSRGEAVLAPVSSAGLILARCGPYLFLNLDSVSLANKFGLMILPKGRHGTLSWIE